MNVQEIFNRVIDAGLYGDAAKSAFMCNSLDKAFEHDLISYEEYTFATDVIDHYLFDVLSSQISTLRAALWVSFDIDIHGGTMQEWLDEVGIPLYRNWDARPMPENSKV